VKEHVLSESDRAALQSLIPLAGALGAGTIFALFFGGRRRGSGTSVFELFAIVAVLVSVGTTAYLAISLLHANEPLGNKELTQTAMPLIFAAFLLVVVSFVSRMPTSVDRITAFVPLALLAILAAVWLASSAWSIEPAEAPVMAIAVLGIGGIGALVAWVLERGDRRWERSNEQRRFVRRSVAGYRVAEKQLCVTIPGRGGRRPRVSCWTRKDGVFLDSAACRQLARRTSSRWERLADERGNPPSGPLVLTRVEVTPDLLSLFRPRTARFWTFQPGTDEEIQVHQLEANDDGLFDVTELGIV
jgi:hypothetical protein